MKATDTKQNTPHPCLWCTLPVPRESPKANNKKFCAPECRKAYTLAHPDPERKAKQDARNHATWNAYKPGKTQCDDCQGWYYGIAYHTTQRHGVTAAHYKELHGLNRTAGLIPQATKERKARATRENGTIENLKAGAHMRYAPKDPRAGRYERRPQTLAMLREYNIKRAQETPRKTILGNPYKTGTRNAYRKK